MYSHVFVKGAKIIMDINQLARTAPENTIRTVAGPSSITVIGVGGVGTAVVSRFNTSKPRGSKCVNADSDQYTLERRSGDVRLLLHKGGVNGKGDARDLGSDWAEANITEIRQLLMGECRDVVLVAGMGGGTGTAAISIIAAEAKAMGATVAAIVTMPLSQEASWRKDEANFGLLRLKPHLDYRIVIEQDRLATAPSDAATWEYLSGVGTLANRLLDDGVRYLVRFLANRRSMDAFERTLWAQDVIWRHMDIWSLRDETSQDTRTSASLAA